MGTTAVTAAGITTAYLVRQYFPPNLWVTMVAIADAESVFNCHAQNGVMTGLFQIDYTVWNPSAQAPLFDCAYNAQIAAQVLQQQGLTAWQSYTSGAYQAYLPLARTLVAQTAPTPTVAAVTLASTFQVTGSVSVQGGSNGVRGQLRLTAQGASLPYRVTMRLTPTYNAAADFETSTSGTLGAGQTVTVAQAIQPGMPSQAALAARQQGQVGLIPFPYTVTWVVTDPQSGAARSVATQNAITIWW